LKLPWQVARLWPYAALCLAAIGLAGSLLLSLGLGLKACPLWFYQRTFVMGVVAVLGVGLVVDQARAGFLCLLSLPLAVGGLGVAAFHEYLVLADKLECPSGVVGLGTAPAQSLTIFVLLTAVTVFGAWAGRHDQPSYCLGTAFGTALLGFLLAWGSVASAPPLPAVPTKAYVMEKQLLDICRPS
jgi:disulfide bond formation protein DsbB